MPLASLTSVSKIYPGARRFLGVRLGGRSVEPVQALGGVSLEIEPGEIVGLIGPNGAGKSTIMRLLAGVITPTSGHVTSCSVVGWAARDDRSFSHRLSGRENLRFFAGLDDLGRDESEARIAEALAAAALTERAERAYRTYSSGMRQALAIARALLRHPQLLLLDEASTGLDPRARERLYERFRRLAKAGTALLIATHQLDEARTLCDRLLLLDGGRIVGEGPPEKLSDSIEALFA